MQKRRAMPGDSVVVCFKPQTNGQKIFALKDDRNYEIYMPKGTVVRFSERLYVSGEYDAGAGKSPGGYLRWKTARISYAKVYVFLKSHNPNLKTVPRMRPVLNTRTQKVLLMHVCPQVELCAKVLSVP